MNSIIRSLALVATLPCLVSCGLLSLPGRIINAPFRLLSKAESKDKALEQIAKTDPKEKVKNQLMAAESLGEVSYVDEESGFILIRQSVGQKIPASTPLLSKNLTGSITARLLASPATKGSFVAADIVSGMPERGNPVHFDADATKNKPTESGAQPSTNDANNAVRQAPKLEPLLPPLEPLSPPSGNIEAPPLPTLPE